LSPWINDVFVGNPVCIQQIDLKRKTCSGSGRRGKLSISKGIGVGFIPEALGRREEIS
jgi:hypothetical protein